MFVRCVAERAEVCRRRFLVLDTAIVRVSPEVSDAPIAAGFISAGSRWMGLIAERDTFASPVFFHMFRGAALVAVGGKRVRKRGESTLQL